MKKMIRNFLIIFCLLNLATPMIIKTTDSVYAQNYTTPPASTEGPFYIYTTGTNLNQPWYKCTVTKPLVDAARKSVGSFSNDKNYVIKYYFYRYYVNLWSQRGHFTNVTAWAY